MQPRDYQQEAINAVTNNLPNYVEPLIISATGGAGKSIVIAKICEWILEKHPLSKILCLADRKELLEQNEGKFTALDDVGVVSAGLKRYEYDNKIVIGGIQTIYNKAHLLGEIDFIIIDECDLVSNHPADNSMYWNLIRQYPKARIIGLTGTPWRTGEGQLTWGRIVYHITYKDLLQKNYLSPVISQIKEHVDKTNWGRPNASGEYTAETIKKEYINKNSIGDWAKKLSVIGADRKSWLIFMPTVESAKDMAFALAVLRIRAKALLSDTPSDERDEIVRGIKSGELRALVAVGVPERGFDAPNIDFIADFFPTKSLKKWLQRIWRGVRLAIGKLNLLYADFAGNIREFGSINNVDIGVSETGKLTVKRKINERICPSCETFTVASNRVCVHCGYEVLVEVQEKQAYLNAENKYDINADVEQKRLNYAWCVVKSAEYHIKYKSKNGKVIPIMAIYTIGTGRKMYNSVFHNDKPVRLAKHGHKFGDIKVENLLVPKKIEVDFSSNFPKIKNYEW